MTYEKRRYPREKICCEILYPTITYGNDKKLITFDGSLFASDLSETGIALQSSFYVPKNCFLSFFLRLGDAIPFQTLLQIKWNKIHDGSYMCGGEFIGLSLEDIKTIRNYLMNTLNEKVH